MRSLGRLSPAAERRLGWSLVIGTFLFAFVVQNQFFGFTNAAKGDIAYHRGVAETMLGGQWQGGGPLPGLLSYYGGLYPMTIGYLSRLFGGSFDGTLSVASWFVALAWPATLLVLGRRIWPGRPLDIGMLVFIGTVGSSIGTNKDVRWASSILPSGANIWPAYPRDIALILLVLALAVAMGGPSLRRAAAVGALAGIAFCVQSQLGFFAVAVSAAWYLFAGGWRPTWAVARRVAAVVATAVVVSIWWWLPRVIDSLRYRPLALQSWPSKPLAFTPVLIMEAFAATGVLAIVGLVVSLRAKRRTQPESFFLVLAIAAVPLVVVGSLLGDQGFITPRRAWFLAAFPVVVLATRAASAFVRRVPLVSFPILLVAIVVPSTVEVLNTRDELAVAWEDRAPRAEPFAAALWDPTIATLQSRVWDEGPLRVLVPDNDAGFVWSETGAQPFSLWLSGADKLGFDARKATGISYVERVRRNQAGFSNGLAGLCGLAAASHSTVLVLRGADGLLATRDVRPSARWRVGPQRRSRSTIDRIVAPGLLYRDKNSFEDVEMARQSTMDLGFSGPEIRQVDVQFGLSNPAQRIPTVTLRLPDGTALTGRVRRDGITVTERFLTPGGVPAGTKIANWQRTTISRVSAYQQVAGVRAPSGSAPTPVVVDRDVLCRNVTSPTPPTGG